MRANILQDSIDQDRQQDRSIRRIQNSIGAYLHSGPSGSILTSSTSFVALTSGPSITITADGLYLIQLGCFMQSQASGLFQSNCKIAKNGTSTGTAATFIGQTTFDGSSVSAPNQEFTLVAGDVLTLVVSNNNTISTSYSSGYITAWPKAA